MLSQLGQIAWSVADVDRTEAFYEQTLGLKKLYRYGDLVFFDCAGVRLMLAKPENGEPVTPQGAIYFKVPDLLPPDYVSAVRESRRRSLRAAIDGSVKAFESSPDARLLDTSALDVDGAIAEAVRLVEEQLALR